MIWQSLFSGRVGAMRGSDIRDAFKLAEAPGIISFAGGFPSPDTFSEDSVAKLAKDVIQNDHTLTLQYGPTEGFYPLRQMIAGLMGDEGMRAIPEEVVVTNGSQQALDLVFKLFLDPGDAVIVELPGYIGGLAAITNYGADKIGIPLDGEGMRTDILEAMLTERLREGLTMPKLAYLVPNFQNPSGVTLSLKRRMHLLELAETFGFLIVEDDPYGSLRFEGAPVPSLKSLDGGEKVLYLGSFSKTLLPGLRVGWVQAPLPVIEKLVFAKQGTDLCSNSIGQRVVLEILRKGDFKGHKQGLVDFYRNKRDIMLGALERHMPAGVSWTRPCGGFFCWVTLPADLDAKQLLAEAVRQELVAYVSGGAFFCDGSGKNTIRLAYSQTSDGDIEEGVARLGRFLTRQVESDMPFQAS